MIFNMLFVRVFLSMTLVPDETSLILRYIIEQLFVIHGERKLNMICPIGSDPEKRYGRPYNLVWCAGLNHPTVSTTTSSRQ
jgi:hypothetical protein